MRRSPWTRALSAIFAVWLALVMGEAGFIHHRCPMHDGPMPAGMGTHAAAHGGHGGHDAPGEHGHHVCTCIGACSASSGAATLAEPTSLPAAVIAFVTVATNYRDGARAHTPRPAFLLPFANGPPRAIA